MSRIQRFFLRVRGTQRLIFFGILAYDLYIYYGLIQVGLWWFVAFVVPAGIVAGTIAGGALQHSPGTLERLINGAGLTAMGIFLVSQCFELVFPFWVYTVGHILLWFWFTANFWYASRPLEFDLDFAEED